VTIQIKATEQYFPEGTVCNAVQGGSNVLSLWMKPQSLTIEMKATEQSVLEGHILGDKHVNLNRALVDLVKVSQKNAFQRSSMPVDTVNKPVENGAWNPVKTPILISFDPADFFNDLTRR